MDTARLRDLMGSARVGGDGGGGKCRSAGGGVATTSRRKRGKLRGRFEGMSGSMPASSSLNVVAADPSQWSANSQRSVAAELTTPSKTIHYRGWRSARSRASSPDKRSAIRALSPRSARISALCAPIRATA